MCAVTKLIYLFPQRSIHCRKYPSNIFLQVDIINVNNIKTFYTQSYFAHNISYKAYGVTHCGWSDYTFPPIYRVSSTVLAKRDDKITI